ncbi:MAG: hemolysin III family protein [Gammaproteobacteria bacterium]|nr:hemolysin III family protein [Gammaproteobacteria bacterium]
MDHGEKLNTITHLVGAVAALAGLVILVVFAALKGDPWKIVSFSVYGTTLFGLYVVSTLYHGSGGKLKETLSILDHQAIYLLIAGTYTPFTLVTLRGTWGWSLFGAIWGIAALGIVLDALPTVRKGRRILPVILYVVMGWLILIALGPLLRHLPMMGFWWLAAGGLFYTLGIVFYALSDKLIHAHGIWHLFVIVGSVCHYISIFMYVA